MKKEQTLTLRQYAKNCGTSHQTVSAAIDAKKIVDGFDEKTGRINPSIADLEWGADFMQKRIIKELGAGGKKIVEDDEDWNPFDGSDEEIPYNTKVPELIRLELLYKARMAKLKVEEAVKKLVNKDEMFLEFFDIGQEIRSAMLAIPDRIIDQLISMDRHNAHKLLTESINQALEKLSEENEDSN